MSDKIEPKIVCGCCGGSKQYIPFTGPAEQCGTCNGEGVVDNPAAKSSDKVPPLKFPEAFIENGHRRMAALEHLNVDQEPQKFDESSLLPLHPANYITPDKYMKYRTSRMNGTMNVNAQNVNRQAESRIHRELPSSMVNEVRHAVDTEIISFCSAMDLSRLEPDDQREKLSAAIAAHKVLNDLHTASVEAKKARFANYFNKANFASFMSPGLGKVEPKYEGVAWKPSIIDYEDIIDETAIIRNVKDKQIMYQKAQQMGANFQLQMEAYSNPKWRKWMNEKLAPLAKKEVQGAMVQIGDTIYADFETSK